ncbi:hypothetical protein Taro_042397 [Colocasia esculenta]|uniref:Uncharacterized protein n=1 Tax=Colocasia esculenta TaxID=4460 RepID=A0A843WGR0_COLES|nr:hypothetical protein [Colocasia esculenta]
MTNPEIATEAYKDSDRAVRPGVRSRQVHMRKATRAVRHGSGRDRSQQTNGEEDELLVIDPQLPSHQELLHTTPASSKTRT